MSGTCFRAFMCFNILLDVCKTTLEDVVEDMVENMEIVSIDVCAKTIEDMVQDMVEDMNVLIFRETCATNC